MVGTAQSRLCPPYGISSDLNFQAAKREAFESHLTPPLREEVEIRGSEFRVRGSLQEHGVILPAMKGSTAIAVDEMTSAMR